MIQLGYEHGSDECRLFVDTRKTSLKAVSLHNGNAKQSIPIAHDINMKEIYKAMKTCLEVINYFNNNWKIWKDFKITSLIIS